MSETADIIRNRRQALAEPGGPHDRMIHFLSRALPAAIGVLAAIMVISPLSPRGEVGFLLDRNKVAVIKDRLRVDNAMYRGQDRSGRPFSLTAGNAVQRSSAEGIVRMKDLSARILLDEGPAVLDAESGRYDIRAERVNVDGPVRFSAADGYRMVARGVVIDLENRQMLGQGRVEGAIPAGTFSADRLQANLAERTVTLIGNARLHMEPGKLRIP